jgi:hypothetical protein
MDIFYGRLEYFMTIWYILCSFGTFLPVLVSWTKKNLATLTTIRFQTFSNHSHFSRDGAGLPDFLGTAYQNEEKYTKWPQNIPQLPKNVPKCT